MVRPKSKPDTCGNGRDGLMSRGASIGKTCPLKQLPRKVRRLEPRLVRPNKHILRLPKVGCKLRLKARRRRDTCLKRRLCTVVSRPPGDR